MNNSFSELKKNTLIIAIANLGSKFIAFILAPLYSYYMTTSQYGIMDLVNSLMGLLLPFVCLDVYEATFRYSSDDKYERNKVLSTSIIISIPGFVICMLLGICGGLYSTEISYKYGIVISCCIMLGAVNSILSQFLRGSDKMLRFALSGIVASIVLLASNYFLLVVFKMGLVGWLLSFLVSKVFETLFLLITSDFFKVFSVGYFDKEYARVFLKFCIPLMPTTTMWWIMNLSDRYMLAWFVGTSATGIYAVANKLPGLLSVFESIFYQAWQTTAISNLKSDNRDDVYSKVFNNYFTVMSVGIIVLLLVAKPLVVLLFQDEYVDAWMYIPFLILGVLIHALNGNLGSFYSVFKNTKGALYSTAVGAVSNIILNIILIPVIGIMGAALSTVIGYVFTLVYRWIDTKKFVKIRLQNKCVFELIVMIIIQMVFYYREGGVSYVIRGIVVILALVRYRQILFTLIKRH